MKRSIHEKINTYGYHEQYDCHHMQLPNMRKQALSKNWAGLFKNWEKQKGTK